MGLTACEAMGRGGTRFPCGSVLGSTWDPELLEALGAALGREARAKAVSILLGPTINLQRTLLGGRNFEAYSEDPELTAALGEAFVRGVQSQACRLPEALRHQRLRNGTAQRICRGRSPNPRRVLPLPLRTRGSGGRAWAMMSAYHRLGGIYCAAHRGLLTEILRDRWGFDGVVVSDWGGPMKPLGPRLRGSISRCPGRRRCAGRN